MDSAGRDMCNEVRSSAGVVCSDMERENDSMNHSSESTLGILDKLATFFPVLEIGLRQRELIPTRERARASAITDEVFFIDMLDLLHHSTDLGVSDRRDQDINESVVNHA